MQSLGLAGEVASGHQQGNRGERRRPQSQTPSTTHALAHAASRARLGDRGRSRPEHLEPAASVPHGAPLLGLLLSLSLPHYESLSFPVCTMSLSLPPLCTPASHSAFSLPSSSQSLSVSLCLPPNIHLPMSAALSLTSPVISLGKATSVTMEELGLPEAASSSCIWCP